MINTESGDYPFVTWFYMFFKETRSDSLFGQETFTVRKPE